MHSKSLKKDLLNYSIEKKPLSFKKTFTCNTIFDSDGVSAIPILLFMNILVMLLPCFICGQKEKKQDYSLYNYLYRCSLHFIKKIELFFTEAHIVIPVACSLRFVRGFCIVTQRDLPTWTLHSLHELQL